MRPISLSLLVSSMLACSGSSDNPGELGSGGRGGAGADSGYCGDLTESLVTGSGTPIVETTPLSTTEVASSTCGAVERAFPPDAAFHTDACTELEYGTNPPSSGAHYGSWPAFKVYDAAVPRGFLVHAMEHGAVVIAYSCTECDAEIDAARMLVRELGPDPLCCTDPSCTGATTRLILAPDPRLDTPWAAAAWGATLVGDCFEPEVFRSFVEAHRGRGPEGVCAQGIDVE
jgi:hypothetical protein